MNHGGETMFTPLSACASSRLCVPQMFYIGHVYLFFFGFTAPALVTFFGMLVKGLAPATTDWMNDSMAFAPSSEFMVSDWCLHPVAFENLMDCHWICSCLPLFLLAPSSFFSEESTVHPGAILGSTSQCIMR